MYTVRVFKARPVGEKPVDDMEIIADITLMRDRTEEMMQLDAANMATALTAHLPGGTIDRLTAILMKQAASRLVVRHEAS